MKLNYKGLRNTDFWKGADIVLPSYDPEALAAETRRDPRWAHFGIGNIFRVFVGGIADRLLNGGWMNRGITCIETYDFDVVEPCKSAFWAVFPKRSRRVPAMLARGRA